MNKSKEHIGQKIKRLRAFRGLTQEELAEAIGKTRSLVSFLERTGNVNRFTLQEIAAILKTSTDALETGGNMEEIEPESYSPNQQYQALIDQLQSEISFLKETIQHQWHLLKELSKSK